MKSNYEPLGKHIQLVDYRNSEEVTSTVLGISIDKEFMPSVANVIGTDLSRYKLISKGLFACNPMHVGRDERLPIALYEKDSPAIVSPAYFMFEIIDRDVLNEEYLMMWFRRPEFDRECWFMTDGSVRGGITWDDLCRIKLPVPSYARQCEIVESYRAITDRIALKRAENDNLEATGSTLYRQVFESFGDTLPIGWRIHHLSEYLPVITGKKDANTTSPDGQYPFFSCSQDILWTKEYSFEADAILVAGNGDFNVKNYSGKFEAYQRTYVLIPKNELFCGWLYYVVKHHLPKATTAARGSVISFITKGILENIAFAVPDDFDELRLFCEKANAIVKAIRVNNSEILELQRIQLIVLEQLSR